MELFQGIEAAAGRVDGGAVTIGNFDGLHVGHRRLLARTRALASESGGRSAVLTFEPHPVRVLAPALAPPRIVPPGRKRALIESAGVDVLVEQPFDRNFAAQSADAFAALLLDTLHVRAVVVGHDFTYGRSRGGDITTLKAACEARGAKLEVVPPVTVDGLVASSTKVREFVLAGKVDAAASLLGRPFVVSGPVVRGAGRGRTIGVPTANVATREELLPALGVYATRVTLPDGATVAGACNVGLNPTFRTEGAAAPPVSVEVHLLDWSGDLYGSTLEVAFLARIRAERKFPGVDALVAQIRSDIEEVRRVRWR
ncbi:MAG: hypothetical protein RL199_1329 [Pseudomonadota bacterium]|jgi:riboflavin kinase/FMN adenylyltransferase